MAEDKLFYWKIIFTEEAHFHIGNYVNKQGCRILRLENPQVTLENPMQPQWMTVFCFGTVTPFFVQKYQEGLVNVWWSTSFVSENWREWDMVDIWLQHDEATCHTIIDLLRPVFENWIISFNVGAKWTPRSCGWSQFDHDYFYEAWWRINVTLTSERRLGP